MFAASWALLAVGLLWPRRRTFTIAFLLVWATGVMGSRLLLGMHWPRDLVVATLISAISYHGDRWRSEFAGRLCRLAKKRKKLLNASRKADNG